MPSRPGSTPGLRATFQPPPLLTPTAACCRQRPSTVQATAEGICWLGDLSAASQSPGVLPLAAARRVCWLQPAGGRPGLRPRWHRALVQPELGEKFSLAIKPNRVLVLGPGDTLNSIAERYGTTVPTPAQVNPELADLRDDHHRGGRHAQPAGRSPRHHRRDPAQAQPVAAARRWPHGGSGDTLLLLAELYDTTKTTLRNYNLPDLYRYPGSEPLPLGMVVMCRRSALQSSWTLARRWWCRPCGPPPCCLRAAGSACPSCAACRPTDDLWDVDPTPTRHSAA